jgi:hypothetical protein
MRSDFAKNPGFHAFIRSRMPMKISRREEHRADTAFLPRSPMIVLSDSLRL